MEIKIEQSNSYTAEHGSHIKDTKNTHSERTVAFPKIVLELILQHEEDETIKRNLLENKWFHKNRNHQDDFLFTQENGKTMFVDTPSKCFQQFIKKNDLKNITFHGLRNTNTTILIHEGINIINISNSLGHSRTSTTSDFYAHHLETVEREMADTFDRLLDKKKDKKELRIIK